MLCGAKQHLLLSLIIYLLSGNGIFSEKRKKEEKSEENKKKRQSSFENCRFFLVRMKGLEPPCQRHQILSLARLPISPHPQIYLFCLSILL